MNNRAPKEPITRLLSILHRKNLKNVAKLLQPYGIGGGHHYIYLLNILRAPGINQDKLTDNLRLDKATTARSVKQLEEAGYIEKRTDPDDRRAYQLHPTEKALAFEPTLRDILAQANRRLTRSLTEEEEDQLILLLQKLHRDTCE
ncbi:MarR family winged helix-turn-helix transcriptional regulator [Gorillibacterium sp. sgz500922]|uniref:MarR family winged helix-turn-helix transcriptional regulator n=1 Tax=Gorillibacterium sp. sgz500922 TaxID=3446694 RepID=UPI003F6814D3